MSAPLRRSSQVANTHDGASRLPVAPNCGLGSWSSPRGRARAPRAVSRPHPIPATGRLCLPLSSLDISLTFVLQSTMDDPAQPSHNSTHKSMHKSQTHDPYAVSLTHGRHDKSEPIESPRNTRYHITKHLRALATDATGELNVLGHDGHALGMDGAEVGVREEANKVSLRGLLERDDG